MLSGLGPPARVLRRHWHRRTAAAADRATLHWQLPVALSAAVAGEFAAAMDPNSKPHGPHNWRQSSWCAEATPEGFLRVRVPFPGRFFHCSRFKLSVLISKIHDTVTAASTTTVRSLQRKASEARNLESEDSGP